jgi:hypothetical protein
MLGRGFVVMSLAVMLAGCCKQKDEPVRVGSEVEAPWSSPGMMFPGRVTEIYGKMAFIKFDDGDEGWAPVTELDPPGVAGPQPTDTCSLSTGDRVLAPWSKTRKMYAGRIGEVYGKLVLVNFDDGDKGWALCTETKKQ